MSKSLVYSTSLFVSLVVTIAAAIFKIQHWAGTDMLFSVALILAIPFIFLGIRDVFQNHRHESVQKLMWLVGFIFLSTITGLIYHSNFKRNNK
ncbi:MAG TPA: hypothetical protein DGG95_10205 [Cytophagales bacterium]|jgi:hypothetical protein|nr:hypothetical protein [Cytophagales bacterium]